MLAYHFDPKMWKLYRNIFFRTRLTPKIRWALARRRVIWVSREILHLFGI